MSMTIVRRASSARAALGRLVRWHSQGGSVRVGASEAEGGIRTPSVSGRGQPKAKVGVVAARGVIRQEVPLLTHYGTSYGLFDAWIADYECVLKSDAYRLGNCVGDSVWVSGPLTGVIGGMPMMKVTHLELLKLKWMR